MFASHASVFSVKNRHWQKAEATSPGHGGYSKDFSSYETYSTQEKI